MHGIVAGRANKVIAFDLSGRIAAVAQRARAVGLVTALLDHAGGLAVWVALDRFEPIATLDLRVDYMRPARPRVDLLAEARCYRLTRTIGFDFTIVSTAESDKEARVLLSRGDRAYARARSAENPEAAPLAVVNGQSSSYRVFRNAVPLRDPTTNAILAYEAQYVGKATVVGSESVVDSTDSSGKKVTEIVPASLDVVSAKEEMQVGDRLLPEPEREFTNFVPRAPASPQTGQVVSVYGNAVRFAAQNQVVAINRGREHGIERGHVLALWRARGLAQRFLIAIFKTVCLNAAHMGVSGFGALFLLRPGARSCAS